MTTKRFWTSFTVFAVLCLISIIGLIAYQFVPTFNAKEYAKTNHCPYEGYECPNAQQAIHEDSLAYADAEYVIDSLINSNDSLRAQLAGCELQDHSKLAHNE